MIPEYDRLLKDSLFQEWQKNHSTAFLTHFFCHLDSQMQKKSGWDIGFYDKEKMTVFVVNDKIAIKPEDDVFKKPGEVVEKLVLDDVKVNFEQAIETAKNKYPELFPKVLLGDGFLILQRYKELIWNFTFIDKQLRFLNIKIDAVDGKVLSHQAVEMVQKK